jgi:hypothetical protein
MWLCAMDHLTFPTQDASNNNASSSAPGTPSHPYDAGERANQHNAGSNTEAEREILKDKLYVGNIHPGVDEYAHW